MPALQTTQSKQSGSQRPLAAEPVAWPLELGTSRRETGYGQIRPGFTPVSFTDSQ